MTGDDTPRHRGPISRPGLPPPRRIEHWIVAQRQGQAATRAIIGERAPFTDVPFFWTHLYDVAISYVGHAERGDAIEIDGSFQDRDCTVRYAAGGRVAAVATVFRNRASLEAEHRMEQELETARAA